MKLGLKLWPWGVLTLACLALFAFFLVSSLAVERQQVVLIERESADWYFGMASAVGRCQLL